MTMADNDKEPQGQGMGLTAAGTDSLAQKVIPVLPEEVPVIVSPEVASETSDFPAFLKTDKRTGEYELPERYEWVKIPANSTHRKIQLGLMPGDQAIFYIGNVGAILERGDEGVVYFRFPGIPLPESLEFQKLYPGEIIEGRKNINPKGLEIEFLKGKNAQVHISINAAGLPFVIDGRFEDGKSYSMAHIYLPKTIKAGNMSVPPPDLGRWGVVLGFRNLGADERFICIKNFDPDHVLWFAVPSAAKKADGLRPEAEAAAEKVIPVAPKAEVPAVVSPAVTSEAVASAEMEKSWKEIALEMAEDSFAAIGFRQTGNEIVAAAAFVIRAEIPDKIMKKEMFTAMMQMIEEINGITRSYETQFGRTEEQKLEWPQVVDDMGRDKIAKTAFDTTKNPIVAAAAHRFREEILRATDQGASFKRMVEEVNEAAGKYRGEMSKRKT